MTKNWFNQAKLILKFPQIVETEAYPAGCPRVPKATHGPGSTFIYSIYGVIGPYQHLHYNFNTIINVIIFKYSCSNSFFKMHMLRPLNWTFLANTDHSTIITTIEVNKCLNITSEETGACVLLRAASPVQGLEVFVKQTFYHCHHCQGWRCFSIC